ncbi:putative spore cortex biosynthesis protein YabQ [uncultured Eubacteriales bacterium]|uniref:Putative spore cortex biosynthesis protein YabQ n=1 Tax=uncultured Eubacteriales bacterium TaxID=172733 RepID=A0A212IYG6_9FIRM|nr:putative spore cortex biosynthesis protein YabQ [uncultured Eubacteriales bacterium]
MEIPVSGQALALLGALALGAGAGLLYDLMRVLRTRIHWRVLGAALDLLFWLAVTAAIFVYTVTVGGGRVRLFLLGAVLGGAVVYFLLLSHYALQLGYLAADLAGLIWRLLLLPARFLWALCKKIKKFVKNHFHYQKKWYKISQLQREMGLTAERAAARDGGGAGHADEKGGTRHKAGGARPAHRSVHHPAGHAGPAPERPDPEGSAGNSGPGPNPGKRRPERRRPKQGRPPASGGHRP